MCGIAGFIGDYSFATLQRMSELISHRGPDDSGIMWEPSSRLGLAHRRLSILDLSSNGKQPMMDSRGEVTIIFNGEIYNFRDLRRTLITKGYEFRSSSDTEVLLYLYIEYGTQFLEQLNGIFALAIWDNRTQQLLLARDRMGVKPLYISEQRVGVLFSSELKAILAEPSVSNEIDLKAIHFYLSYLWAPAPYTMLRDVRKIPPGTAMIFDRSGKKVREWIFADFPIETSANYCSGKVAIKETQNYLQQAVERQLVSDVPVGAFLSGGLDSSAIAYFARNAYPKSNFECFTISLPADSVESEGFNNDLPYARELAKFLGVRLHEIEVTSKIADDIPRMVYHLDEPIADLAALNTFYIAKLASQNGYKVLLSGLGADDIFAGYRRHQALQLEVFWRWLPRAFRLILSRASRSPLFSKLAGRRLKKALTFADADVDTRMLGYFQWSAPSLCLSLYKDKLKDATSGLSFSEPLAASLASLSKQAPILNRMLYLEQKHFLADHNLIYTDKMSMAAGVEVRVPFLDIDIVSFAASLRPNLKIRNATTKWVLRNAMSSLLPESIINRTKSGFGVPLRYWMKNELRPLLRETLSPKRIHERGIFNSKEIQNLIEENERNSVDASYTLLSLLCIETWCKQFIDQRSSLIANTSNYTTAQRDFNRESSGIETSGKPFPEVEGKPWMAFTRTEA